MRFFRRVLNPFKIQTGFKLELFMVIIIQNTQVFGSWAKRNFVPFEIIYLHAMFGKFWTSGWLGFVISSLKSFGKYLKN
jgi:hypothetical protein